MDEQFVVKCYREPSMILFYFFIYSIAWLLRYWLGVFCYILFSVPMKYSTADILFTSFQDFFCLTCVLVYFFLSKTYVAIDLKNNQINFHNNVFILGYIHERFFKNYGISVSRIEKVDVVDKPFYYEFLYMRCGDVKSFLVSYGKSELSISPIKFRNIAKIIEIILKKNDHVKTSDALLDNLCTYKDYVYISKNLKVIVGFVFFVLFSYLIL